LEDYNSNNGIDELMIFSIEMDDYYNSAIVGQSLSYCINNVCNIAHVKSKKINDIIYIIYILIWQYL